MTEQELLAFMKKRVVQVGISTKAFYRPFDWKKETTYNDEGEKVEEWVKIEGEWKEEKRAFHCSGYILYSGEKAPPGSTVPNIYGHSLIATNFHCVIPFIEEEREKFFGKSKWQNVKRYKPGDIKNTEKIGNWFTPEEEARPIGESYIKLTNKKPIIKYRKDQNFVIHADLEFFDPKLDFALLRMDNVYGLPSVDLGGSPKVGQEVWIGGAPLAIPFSYDKGRVNQINLDLHKSDDMGIGWQKQVKMDIAGAPGSSGSAIFAEDGDVVAMLHGSFVYGKWGAIQGGQLALNARNIEDFLRWNGYAYALED